MTTNTSKEHREPTGGSRRRREVTEDFDTRRIGLGVAENLPRSELYDRERPRAETERERRARILREVIEDIRASSPGFSARESLSREELYDRARARVGMAGYSPAKPSNDT